MKFIRKDNSVITLDDRFSSVSKETSPIKEIINRKDLSEFYFVSDKTISFKELIQIQVNVIDVGVMIFVFETTSFNKDKFIEDVSKLKEIQISSFYDVLSKMKALYAVSENFNPLFVIYVPNGKYQIYDDCFRTIVGNVKTIYATNEKDNSIVETNNISLPAKEKSKDKPKGKGKFSFKETIELFKKEKFHFLFAFVATFLLSVTLDIGIFDAYAGKMLCIFFFICSLAGAFLNFMIYKDAYKQSGFKSLFNILTVIISVIGLLGGFGVYMIFKSITKDVPAVTPHVLMILGMMILIYAISMSLPLLFIFIKKRKK